MESGEGQGFNTRWSLGLGGGMTWCDNGEFANDDK